MTFFRLIPAILSFLVLGAHFLRMGQLGLVAFSLGFLPLLFLPRRWVPIALRFLLLGGALVWFMTAYDLVAFRSLVGMPWRRMALILGGVGVFAILSAWLLRTKKVYAYYSQATDTGKGSAAAFLLTVAILSIVQFKVPMKALLPERFFVGSGWILILILAVYAAWLVEKMTDKDQQPHWRRRVWFFFSMVFFLQLLLGLLGFEKFLMTGELHLPIPALIAAGPIYRGEGLFMSILFAGTVLLIGPAWCSYLCYIGSWDGLSAMAKKKPKRLPDWAPWVRIAILVFVLGSAFALRWGGASTVLAGFLAMAFGLIGVGIMVFVSRQIGKMVHCTVFCPIGWFANFLGKVSPFRVVIGEGCTECGACMRACSYNALRKEDIQSRRPGFTCTLCGDCIGSCGDGQLYYRFLWLAPEKARLIFIVLSVSLHASFLGLARI